jgi:hypothetical protein
VGRDGLSALGKDLLKLSVIDAIFNNDEFSLGFFARRGTGLQSSRLVYPPKVDQTLKSDLNICNTLTKQ